MWGGGRGLSRVWGVERERTELVQHFVHSRRMSPLVRLARFSNVSESGYYLPPCLPVLEEKENLELRKNANDYSKKSGKK